ncbi:hypothetical protein [Catenulispora rubra]|uniref:hypothetical protein n=1 Tax=Catenulispora rubra TaxID=280293 RepID=UPI0018920BAD|nr:hypothetical protein [Catenulispora rubra]
MPDPVRRARTPNFEYGLRRPADLLVLAPDQNRAIGPASIVTVEHPVSDGQLFAVLLRNLSAA